MLSRLTRQEQKILLLLILVITVGMGIHYLRSRSGRHGVWVEPSTSGSAKVSKATAAAGVANQAEQGQEAILPSIARRGDINGRLDLNRATLEQLDQLPGIGAKRAQLIIDYREANNGFRAVEELLNVPGIGEIIYSDLQQYVCVDESQQGRPSANSPRLSSPYTSVVPIGTPGQREQKEPHAVLASDAPVTGININTATSEELKSLDGIGDVLAGRIIQYREEQGPFRSPQDIMKVNGIGKVRYEANKHRIVVK